mmetsp:Transcript_22774/g.54520  ORF Transcript_22774/g.54520 Transcript_22774/m.54520 type:complete len:144 (+) Transcript_22774:164-595(+)
MFTVRNQVQENKISGNKRKGNDDKGDAPQKKRGWFTKDLRVMMYGFGDSEHPLQRTVDLVEDILIEYITEFVHTAMDHASKTGKVQKEDLLFQIRKDPRKFNRAMELLMMDERIKEARRCIEDMDAAGGEDAAAAAGPAAEEA